LAEIHSTAAEGRGVVSRQDKFGHSMPILRPAGFATPSDQAPVYHVYHGDIKMGTIVRTTPSRNWWARNEIQDTPWDGPHENKHQAVGSLFDPMDPAARMERKLGRGEL
jgi:hypothetical protein